MSDELPDRLKSILSSEALWVEPSPELEERIHSLGMARARQGGSRRLRTWLPAAAAVTVLIVGAILTFDRPDWQVDLVATPQAPGASALVSGWNEPEGTRLRFDISGLPEAATGSYYEIWLTSDEGLHVSGGTFNADGVLTAMVGVRRGDFPRIWITLEAVDENTAPSSATLFDSGF
jgi:hypothetical protein